MPEETPEDGAGNDRPAKEPEGEKEARLGEIEAILKTGPGAGNRSGALAFLAFLVVIAAAAHFHLAERGSGGYLNRLDAELINHAELGVAARRGDNQMTVIPAWPLRLYETLRRDMAVYAAAAAMAAYVWSLAARARARREAFILHQRLRAEVGELRRRLDEVEKRLPRDNA